MSRNSLFVPIEAPQPSLMETSTAGFDYQRLACFAILGRDVGAMLLDAGLSERMFWDAVNVEYGVDSQADLSEKDYAQIAARLSAAQKDKDQFDALCGSIRAALGTSLVLVYVRKADGRDKKLYEGPFTPDIEDRCQRYADITGIPVRFHGTNGADGFKWVEPTANKPEPIPVVPKRRQPAHAFEIHRNGLEKHWLEVPFPANSPDVWKWGQTHADITGYDVEITNSDKVVIRSFQATPACAPLPGSDSWITDTPEPTNTYCESCGWEYDVSKMHNDNTCKMCCVYEDWIDSDMDNLTVAFQKHRDSNDSRNWLDSAEALLTQLQQSVDKLRKLE